MEICWCIDSDQKKEDCKTEISLVYDLARCLVTSGSGKSSRHLLGWYSKFNDTKTRVRNWNKRHHILKQMKSQKYTKWRNIKEGNVETWGRNTLKQSGKAGEDLNEAFQSLKGNKRWWEGVIIDMWVYEISGAVKSSCPVDKTQRRRTKTRLKT